MNTEPGSAEKGKCIPKFGDAYFHGIIALLMAGTVCALALMGKSGTDDFKYLALFVIGHYFGSKTGLKNEK